MDIDPNRFDELVNTVARIEKALIGDAQIGHDGLVAQLETERSHRREGDKRLHERHEVQETRLSRLERWKDRAMWTMAGIGAGSAAGGGGIVYMITRIVS